MTYKRLKYLRSICDLTQPQVCERSGVSQAMYSKMEAGRLKIREKWEQMMLPVFLEAIQDEILEVQREIDMLKAVEEELRRETTEKLSKCA